jgi:hypothetical protein
MSFLSVRRIEPLKKGNIKKKSPERSMLIFVAWLSMEGQDIG